jgi:hypothetical protein
MSFPNKLPTIHLNIILPFMLRSFRWSQSNRIYDQNNSSLSHTYDISHIKMHSSCCSWHSSYEVMPKTSFHVFITQPSHYEWNNTCGVTWLESYYVCLRHTTQIMSDIVPVTVKWLYFHATYFTISTGNKNYYVMHGRGHAAL